MAKLLQTLIPLLSSITLLLAAANTVRSQGESTSFTYDFQGDQPTTLTYQRDAYFPSGTIYLRLTRTDANGNAQTNRVGRVLHTEPVLFQEDGAQADFETTVTFIITPNSDKPGDGITFFVAPVGSTFPDASPGGNLGIFGRDGTAANVFAVEFDIFTNNEWDPSFRHVGIDLGSRISSNITQTDSALVGQEVNARIGYVAATKMIHVHITVGLKTFDLTYVYDLGALLTDRVQVGLSASTGYSVAVHDIISWYFSSTLVHSAAAAASGNIREVVA